MTIRFLLDTNIVIYIRRRRPPHVFARFQTLRRGEAAISVISYGELAYGVRKGPAPDRGLAHMNELFELLDILPIPAGAAGEYGGIRADLEATGQVIGSNDLWIAAHARASNLTVVTNNEREFRRVVGLKVENWATP